MNSHFQRFPDRATARRWAAEHLAVEFGLLRECAYHGEPYRARGDQGVPANYCGYATHDPLAAVFGGDPGKLIEEVERVALGYGPACRQCQRAVPVT